MKQKGIIFGLLLALAMSIAVMPVTIFSQSRDVPGSKPVDKTVRKFRNSVNSITPFSTESGFVSLSVDGLGSNAASGIIQVQKPAGATVRKAFMAAASAGFSGRILANGDVTINGTGVNWNLVASIPSSISSNNSLADVTAIVKPVVDAAPTGRVNFTITEVNTTGIDGEILAVVFNDPNQTVNNTIILLFGAQNIAGDDFNIGLGAPINTGDPNLKLDLGLGISFSFQVPPGNVNQVSQVEVPTGTRLSSAAGGQDDSDVYPGANGTLMTVGGLDDTNGNPAPLQPPTTNANIPDDELYNLIPFVTNGQTQIQVHSRNPSSDDNIFFASLFLGSQSAIVGEGIILAPAIDTNQVGTQHTVTATVQNVNGQPISGRSVNIRIKAGPNTGLTATGNTNASGQFAFTYTGNIVGTDTLIARMTNTAGQPDSSNLARKIWRTGGPPPDTTPPSCNITGTIPGPPAQIQVTVRDLQSGLGSVVVQTSTNATVNIPTFTVGTTAPVVITATKINQSLSSTVILRVGDVAQNFTVCDPVYTTLSAQVPQDFALSSNYPNPFNPSTKINFSIAKSEGSVSLKVFDVLGREVKTLISEPMQPGQYFVEWDGTNNQGIAVTSGVYIYRMVAGDFVATRRMTLMK